MLVVDMRAFPVIAGTARLRLSRAMADGGALNEYDEVLATARVRTNRVDSRAAHQKVNDIQVRDVVSVAHQVVVVSTETAKTLNPALGDTTEMTDDARAEALTFFAVHSRPPDATVRSKGYTHTNHTHTNGWQRFDQARAAALFGTEASVLNAFVGGGLGGKIAGARRPAATVGQSSRRPKRTPACWA